MYVRFGGRRMKTRRRKAEMGVILPSLQNGDQDVKKAKMILLIKLKYYRAFKLI